MTSPVFLISLPRSGSTVLQKAIMSASDIATTNETWFLLPLLTMQSQDSMYAEYSHILSVYAYEDLREEGHFTDDTLTSARRLYADAVYKGLSQGKKLFLDKTPRYYLIIDEIYKVYPNAKVIFLFRNPISILSSIMETWGNGGFKAYLNAIDLFEGPKKLVNAASKYAATTLKVNYEEFVNDPRATLTRISVYLEYDFEKLDSKVDSNVDKVQIRGRLGDPYRLKAKNISDVSVLKYRKVLSSRFRKWIAKRYISHTLGRNIVTGMGYEYADLMSSIDEIKVTKSRVAGDLLEIASSYFKYVLGYKIIRARIRRKIKLGERNFPLS